MLSTRVPHLARPLICTSSPLHKPTIAFLPFPMSSDPMHWLRATEIPAARVCIQMYRAPTPRSRQPWPRCHHPVCPACRRPPAGLASTDLLRKLCRNCLVGEMNFCLELYIMEATSRPPRPPHKLSTWPPRRRLWRVGFRFLLRRLLCCRWIRPPVVAPGVNMSMTMEAHRLGTVLIPTTDPTRRQTLAPTRRFLGPLERAEIRPRPNGRKRTSSWDFVLEPGISSIRERTLPIASALVQQGALFMLLRSISRLC